MFNGYSTLGAVALEIMRSNLGRKRVQGTRHTIEQAIETVCWRGKTLSAYGSNTSYVWWWFALDGNEIMIEYDHGSMTEVRFSDRSWRYVPLVNGDFQTDQLIQDYLSDQHDYSNAISPYETAMLKMGVQPNQRCLSTYSEHWSRDYYGESDCDIECDLLYVEPTRSSVVYLPIAMDEQFAPDPMKGFYHADLG